MKILILSLIVLMVFVGTPEADEYKSAIVLGDGYSIGTVYCWVQNVGDIINIYGFVSELRAPFDDIVIDGSTNEVTYSYESFECTEHGHWDDFNNYTGNWYANYHNGTLRIYLDDSPDADYSDTSTFKDGTILLEAQFEYLLLGTIPSLIGRLKFTGGSLFDRVSKDGIGYQGDNIGTYWCYLPEEMWDTGYLGTSYSTIDIHIPVPVEGKSWGAIKAIYK